MQDLFSFQLPNPLPPEGWRILRARLSMKSYNGASNFKGVGHIEHGIQAYLLEDGEKAYQLAVRSVYPLSPERVMYLRAKVAQIAQAAGSVDPQTQQAVQRQRPREEGPVRYPSHAHNKRKRLSRLLGRS